MEGAWYNDASAPKYKYLYNGKELNEEFNLNFYDYGARWLDPGMGSWWEVNPASEGNRRWSPYAYGNNNPVRFTDPDGRESSAYGGFTSSDEIAAQHAATTEARDNKKSWVQQFLDYLGVFTQPESEEEAAEYAARQERFANVANYLEKGGEVLKSKAEYLPVVGGIVNISQGAVKKNNTQVAIGMASIALDALPGGKTVKTSTQAVNRIYSTRELIRRNVESGPFHNFPESFNKIIFEKGTKTTTPNYFNVPKPGLSNSNVLYKHPGIVNGTRGFFEIGVRPSLSGKTEVIMHRFFNPTR